MPTRVAHVASCFELRAITSALVVTLLVLVAPISSARAEALFSAPFISFDAGESPASVAIADLNADGRPDLAVANSDANTVSVPLGNGDGTFGTKTDFGAGNSPRSVAIADLNADGRPDLAVANLYSQTVWCCWGTATAHSGP